MGHSGKRPAGIEKQCTSGKFGLGDPADIGNVAIKLLISEYVDGNNNGLASFYPGDIGFLNICLDVYVTCICDDR